MDSTHRKIELQAPADLSYLIGNASRAARQKIDLHFPPSAAPAGEDDKMKRRVEELVEQYIASTFAGVRQSIAVNGLEGAEMDKHFAEPEGGEEIETYDHRLAARIQDVSGQIESLTLELANLRRSAPADAAARFQTQFVRDSEAWDARFKAAEEEKMRQAQDVELDIAGLERAEEMQRVWEKGTQTLVGVKDGIGATVARMERAQGVVEYLRAN